MNAKVLRVVPELHTFIFRPLNSPKGYAGTRSYAQSPIHNEAGKLLGYSAIPGKMGSFFLDSTVTDADFTDWNGDGVTGFHVYHFGPGDTVRLSTFASARRMDGGDWEVTANCPVNLEVGGKTATVSASMLNDGTARVRLK